MKTRDRILETGLRLFNEEGLAKVSTNRIASELDISPGNLYYHFKSKEQLVEWLFRRLENEMAPFTEGNGAVAALDDVWLTLHLTFETIEKYRFVFADVDYLAREYPRLGERLRRMTARAVAAMAAMCGSLRDTGVIVADDDQLDSLALQIVLTATCWSTFTKLAPFRASATAGAGFAAYHVLTLLNPYLVPEARHYMNYLRGKYING